jgi:transmembrane sensor
VRGLFCAPWITLTNVPSEDSHSSPRSEAAQWLARRDRGLTPTEQDEYFEWLRKDAENARWMRQLEIFWIRLDRLRERLPTVSSTPNPDLHFPSSSRKRLWPAFVALAAAGVFAFNGNFALTQHHSGVTVHPRPQQITLEDGSLVELNETARIASHYTADLREVSLLRGEAHFIVAKNPARPFIVSVGDYQVRAVGTAFDIKMEPNDVSVLVTQGKVQLGGTRVKEKDLKAHPNLTAGQLAMIANSADASREPTIRVRDLSPTELEGALAWQSLRLEFADIPLREVVKEFNRFNARKLVIEDADTGNIAIGGTFRADNVDAFVRLLEIGFSVAARDRGDAIILAHRKS